MRLKIGGKISQEISIDIFGQDLEFILLSKFKYKRKKLLFSIMIAYGICFLFG